MIVETLQGFWSWYLLSLCCIPSRLWIILQFWEWVCNCSVLCCGDFCRERQLCWSSWTLFYQCSQWGRNRTWSQEYKSQRHADASGKEVLVAQVVMPCVTIQKNKNKNKTRNRFSSPENKFLRDFWKGGGSVKLPELEKKEQKLWKLFGFLLSNFLCFILMI